MAGETVRVIVNPMSGGGRAGRNLPRIAAALKRHGVSHEIAVTGARGDASRLARNAFQDGCDVIAVVGGDGSMNEVAQAFVDGDGGPPGHAPDLALIPAGTGSDFAKTLGLPSNLDEAVLKVREGTRRPVDLGVLKLTAHDNRAVTRAFVNIASFGLSGLVDKVVNESPKWMGGRLAFFLGGVRARLRYKNIPVRIRVDGKTTFEGPLLLAAIANGQYFGGGMRVAPDADPSDGVLQVVSIGALSFGASVGLSTRIYTGAHIGMAAVRVAAGTTVEAEPLRAWDRALIDLDGETPGVLPITASLLPRAMTFRV